MSHLVRLPKRSKLGDCQVKGAKIRPDTNQTSAQPEGKRKHHGLGNKKREREREVRHQNGFVVS